MCEQSEKQSEKCGFREKVEELAKCKGGCGTAGHYECWRENCDCICHAARRVLGVARPKTYFPVPRGNPTPLKFGRG